MKRSIYMVAACLMAATTVFSAGINYNGSSLSLNTDFTRSECGTAKKKVILLPIGRNGARGRVVPA